MDFWDLGQHQCVLEKELCMKRSKFSLVVFFFFFLRNTFSAVFFIILGPAKSVCLSRCFICGLNPPPASCSLTMLIIAQWDLFMWISVYNDWFIEFIKAVRTFLSLYWYCSSQGFTSLYWAIEFLKSCHIRLEIPILRCIKSHKYASANANVDLHNIIILFFHVLISAAIINHIGV